MAKRDLLQLWIRGDEEFRKRVNDEATSLGFKTADYLREIIEFGMKHSSHTFFIKGDDYCSQETTKKLK